MPTAWGIGKTGFPLFFTNSGGPERCREQYEQNGLYVLKTRYVCNLVTYWPRD